MVEEEEVIPEVLDDILTGAEKRKKKIASVSIRPLFLYCWKN